ncbi:hypothetical protein HPB50_014821 [Hyalomma asiaticum]|uniref:Uncharacterized protein n=1 Tax=Hyalomma asiaticum TaxID=266040 RepID=A0ACB7RUK0_HYAAI|nr:hypothetical protein HPB50_014821 [Hyalomma asiaticum]
MPAAEGHQTATLLGTVLTGRRAGRALGAGARRTRGARALIAFRMHFGTSGYRSNNERVSLFSAPADPGRLAEWKKNIKSKDRRLTLDGVINEIPREKPCLTSDAVPTIFDDHPSHEAPRRAPKRKDRARSEEEPTYKRRKHDLESDETCAENHFSRLPTMQRLIYTSK